MKTATVPCLNCGRMMIISFEQMLSPILASLCDSTCRYYFELNSHKIASINVCSLKGHLATIWLKAYLKVKTLRSARNMLNKSGDETERRVFAREIELATRRYHNLKISIKETRIAIKDEERSML